MDSFWWYITLKGANGQEEILATAADITGSIGSEVQELPDGVRLRAYYKSGCDLGDVLRELNGYLSPYPMIKVEDSGRIENQPWYRECEEAFPPLDVGRSLVVLAPWHSENYSSHRTPVVVKPGSAFGTGYHESTQIALELMEPRIKKGASVVDVGTGSGILAIGAMLLGAECVTARDIDGAVLSEVDENLSLNGLLGKIAVEEANLLDGFDGSVDMVVSNILFGPLGDLLPSVGRVLKKDGFAVFAGLLFAERDDFIKLLLSNGLLVEEEKCRGEWWGVAAKNKA